MATETKSEKPEPDAAAEEAPVDQQALGLSKHLTAWRESYGDDVVDAALELSAGRRKAEDKASAGQARADAGQQPSAAPAGRSASNPKSTATA